VRKAGLIATLTMVATAFAAIGATSAIAKPGDIIVGDSGNAEVIRVNPKTGAKTVISDDTRFDSPNDTVFGRNGTIYVADYQAFDGGGGVFAVNPKTGATSVVSDDPLFEQPDGIAMGPDGDLYVTDLQTTNANLLRVDLPSGETSVVVADDPLLDNGPLGVVVPPNAIPIVATSEPLIARVNPLSGAVTTVADEDDGLAGGEGLTRGPDGMLYFADSTEGLQAVNPATGAVSTVADVPDYDSYGLTYDFHDRIVFGDGTDLYSVSLRNGGVETIAQDFGYPEGSEVEPPRCKGKTATIVGSVKKDKLKGSRFKDVIATLGGKDKVNAKGGNDIVCGGKGKDKLKGGKGRDKLFGQGGKDKLNGGPGKDKEQQ
jgi:Ca2+-binding RTX toxin-like protein